MERWLRHHDLDPAAVLRAFLVVRARGAKLIHRACPHCSKSVGDLDSAALAKPSGTHTYGHCCTQFTEDIPGVCNPLAEFMPVVAGGKPALAHEDFV